MANPVTVPDTPSQSIIKAANQVESVTDSKGRTITIRKMLALDKLRMFEVIGADNSNNMQYLGMAMTAFHVSAIDDDAVPKPATKVALEGLIQRLGDEGLDAVRPVVETYLEVKKATSTEQIKN